MTKRLSSSIDSVSSARQLVVLVDVPDLEARIVLVVVRDPAEALDLAHAGEDHRVEDRRLLDHGAQAVEAEQRRALPIFALRGDLPIVEGDRLRPALALAGTIGRERHDVARLEHAVVDQTLADEVDDRRQLARRNQIAEAAADDGLGQLGRRCLPLVLRSASEATELALSDMLNLEAGAFLALGSVTTAQHKRLAGLRPQRY
jgi:hypothetical protein